MAGLPTRDLAPCLAQLDVFSEDHKRKYIPGEVAEGMHRRDAPT